MFSFFDLNPQNVFGAMQLTNVDPIRGDWAHNMSGVCCT